MTASARRTLNCSGRPWLLSRVPINATQATSANQISRLTRRSTFGRIISAHQMLTLGVPVALLLWHAARALRAPPVAGYS